MTYREMAKMLGFDDAAAEAAYGDMIDQNVPQASDQEIAESFVVGVDTNIPPSPRQVRSEIARKRRANERH